MPSWDSKNHREFLGVVQHVLVARLVKITGASAMVVFAVVTAYQTTVYRIGFCTPCYGVLFVHQTWDGIGVSLVVGSFYAGF